MIPQEKAEEMIEKELGMRMSELPYIHDGFLTLTVRLARYKLSVGEAVKTRLDTLKRSDRPQFKGGADQAEYECAINAETVFLESLLRSAESEEGRDNTDSAVDTC